MAKIDDTIAAIATGFQDPQVTSGTMWVADEQIEELGVRRKKSGEPRHKLWYFSVGETGQQPAVFYGHKFTDALKKAMKWRGMETKTKRGPKAANGQAATA
jgi:hypothetical protein